MSSPWYINATDSTREGLMQGSDQNLQQIRPTFVRGDQLPRQIHILDRDDAYEITKKPYARRSITGCSLKVAVHEPDLGPSGGTFALSYDGSSTGLTTLAYNISAAALQTALNANGNISGDGGVTVTGGDGVFVISFVTVNDKSTLIGDGELLEPECYVDVVVTREGTGSVKEKQVVRLLRRPYAYSEDWTVTTPSSTGTVTLIEAGSSSSYAVAEVVIPSAAISGSFRLGFGGTAERYNLTISHATPGDYNNLFWDAEDNAGPVRFWVNYNATGSAPTTPPGGRLIAIAIVPGDNTTALIATKFRTAISGDSQFSGTYIFGPSNVVAVVNTSAGERDNPTISSPLSGYITAAVTVAGANGLLGEFPWDVKVTALSEIFGDDWTITQTSAREFRFVATELGAAATPTITNNFEVPSYFSGALNFSTTRLLERFAELDPDTDPNITDAFLEVELTDATGVPETILRIPTTLVRDIVDTGTVSSEILTIAGATAPMYLSAVTGYTGGGATNLDGIPTIGLAVPKLAMIYVAGDGLQTYILQAGSTAESSPNVIRPDDYDAGTNQKIWVLSE